MTPRALDRGELRRRLAADADGWVVDELADAFEPAFLAFQRAVAAAARKKSRRGGRGESGGPRARQGRPIADDPADSEGDDA